MREQPVACPEGRQEGCRQKKGIGGWGEAASPVMSWGPASLPPPVWASGASRASRPFRSTPGDNATPTGCPGVVRRVDRLRLDPLVGCLPGVEPRLAAAGSLPFLRPGLQPSGSGKGGVGRLVVEVKGRLPFPPHLRGSFVMFRARKLPTYG